MYNVPANTFPMTFDQQQAKHRHRRQNTVDDGYGAATGEESSLGGPIGPADDGGEENFIALAPDEADIYNFSNIMSMTMANGPGGAGGTRSANVNEANPFNEFRNTPRQRDHSPGQDTPGDIEQLPSVAKGEKELPELTLDDDDGDDANRYVGDGGALGERIGTLRGRFDAEPNREDEDGGNGGEVESESDDDNAIERSRYLTKDMPSDDGQDARTSRTDSDAALLSNSIDFLNSIDGAYLLANGAGGGQEGEDGEKRSDLARKILDDNGE
uniref:Uncharacterized protein n=1 Tax=Anopheles maculatus TaxID=74869 RepID=A0A182S6S8_9DIPT